MNRAVFGLLTLVLATAVSVHADWQTLAPMSAARIDAIVAVDEQGGLYVIGGSDDSSYLDSVEHYSPATGWESLAGVPHPIAQADAIYHGGKIFIAGGFDGTALSSELLIYDIGANTWSTGSSAPVALYGSSFEQVGDLFYLVGGADASDTSQPTCFEYDPVGDAWQEKAVMGHARRYHGSAVVEGKLYVFGGIDDATPPPNYLASAEVYDPEQDAWSDIAEMPVTFWGGSSGAVDGAPWACHGLQDSEPSALCWSYDVAGDAWSAAASAAEARFHVASGVFPLFAVGGLQQTEAGYRPSDIVEQYGEAPVDDDTVDDDTVDDVIDDDTVDDDATDDDLADDDTLDDDQTPDDDITDDDAAPDDDAADDDHANSESGDDNAGCGC
jgi:hypothetical protein